MARRFLTAIDLSKNELQNAAIQNLASAPSSPVKGQLYFDSTGNVLYWWNGTAWVAAQGGGALAPASTVTTSAIADAAVVGVSTNYAREDHKHAREAFGGAPSNMMSFGMNSNAGSAVTNSRSDHNHGTPAHNAAEHATIPHSALAAATADVSMGGFKITSLAQPIAVSDAANKQYVDALIAGLSWKAPVRAATTANITLSAPQTIDGVAVITGDRVLVKNQVSGSTNGIYLVQASTWGRSQDADIGQELANAAVFVAEGTTQADTSWVCTTDAITIGSTSLSFVQFSGAGTVTAGAGLTQTGNTLNVVGDSTLTVAADTMGVADLGITTAKIANDVVDNTKLANMVQNSIKGRITGGTSDPEDLTPGQLATMMANALARVVIAFVGGGTSWVHTHNLNTRDLIVNVYRSIAPYDTIECDVERTDVNNVTLRFAQSVTANEYRLVIHG